MKRISYVLACFLFFLLNACGEKSGTTATSAPENKHFQSDTLHCGMDYPGHWSIDYPRDSNSMVVFSEPLQDSADRFQENIRIWTETIPFPLPDSSYKVAAMTQLRLANPELQVQRLEDIDRKAGKFSHFRFEFRTADSSRYVVNGYTMLKGRYGYNLSLTCEASTAAHYLPIMHALLQSFQTIP